MTFRCLKFSKKTTQKFWQIYAQDSKKWSNHKIKALYNLFNTLNSPYNHMKVLVLQESAFILLISPLFRFYGRNLSNFCIIFLKKFWYQSHSEINWPLVGASFEGLSVVIEGYQRPTMKLLDDMKTLLNDSETVALIVKFSKRLYKYDRLKISIYQKFTHLILLNHILIIIC